MAAASLVVRVSAQVAEFQKSFADATRTTQKFERDFANTASSVSAQQKRINDAFSSFSGDRLARDAHAVARAVEQIGGASKLTAGEQARVNSTVTEAIAKYKALGQIAPKALVDLEQATRRVEVATTQTYQRTGIFANSVSSLGDSGSKSALAMNVLTGTFGKFTLAGVAVGVVNKLGGALADMVTQGTKIAPLQDAFKRLADGVGENSDGMLRAMNVATRGMVADFDLMQSANKALLLGLPTTTESMAKLGRTATILGKAMGQDATKSLDDLIIALGRSSPLILDNLGLTVKVEEANRKYADALGKTSDALTEAEKKQAFMNEAMRKADERVKQIGEQSLTLVEHSKTIIITLSNIVTGAIGAVDRAAGEMITKGQNAIGRIAQSVSDLTKGGPAFDPAFFSADDLNEALHNFATAVPPAAKAAVKLADGVKKVEESSRRAAPAMKSMADATLGMVRVTEGFGRGNEAMRDWLDDIKAKLAEDARLARELDAAMRGLNITIKTGLDGLNLPGDVGLSGLGDGAIIATREVIELSHALREVTSLLDYLAEGFGDSAFSEAIIDIADIAAAWSVAADAAEKYGKATSAAGKAMALLHGAGAIANATSSENRGSATIGGAVTGMQLGMAVAGPYGAAVGAVAGAIVGLVRSAGQGREAVEKFADSFGGFDPLHKKLLTLGNDGERLWIALTQGVGKNNPTQARELIEGITEAFRLQGEEMAGKVVPSYAEVSAAAGRYGLDLMAIGDGINQLRVTDFATQSAADWELLSRSGADMAQVAAGMADEFQVLVDEAVIWGHTLPASMRAPLEKMAEMGLLTGKSGEKLEDLSDIKFEKPLVEAVDTLIGKMDELIDKITGGLGGALRNLPASLPSGGIVALPGNGTPGPVLDENSVRSFGGGSAPIVTQVYLDGRQIAEATVPHIPNVVRRRA